MVASRMTRRTALAALAGALVARNAFATPDQARDWIAAMAKGTPTAGKVSLKAPEIAENGNAVPLTVTVDSEMSEKSYVKALYIAADGNPNAGVAVYEFSPLAGKAEVALRVRLADIDMERVFRAVKIARDSKALHCLLLCFVF